MIHPPRLHPLTPNPQQEAHARRKQQLADVYERKRVRQQETWRWKSAAWAEYRSKQHAAAASGVEVIST